MRRRALAALAAALLASLAGAQQTIFNVPSADVLGPRTVYLENDWYARPWDSGAGRAGLTTVRGVAGLGRGVEAGLNLGSFDALHESGPFADAAVKWAPEPLTSGSAGAYLGGHAGIGLAGAHRGEGRSLSYAAAWARPHPGLRVGAGPYFATRTVFGDSSRGGALATFEMKTGVSGLTLAADWFSGDGGYATPGLIGSAGPFTWYAGYGFANTGRRDDLLTLELGVTFSPDIR